jgi:hypothetical protein
MNKMVYHQNIYFDGVKVFKHSIFNLENALYALKNVQLVENRRQLVFGRPLSIKPLWLPLIGKIPRFCFKIAHFRFLSE